MQIAIAKRVKSLFFSPKMAITRTLEQLIGLQVEIRDAMAMRDPLTGLVEFFNAVSRWHDRTLKSEIEALKSFNYGQLNHVIETLENLDGRFSQSGRHPHGCNRTKKDQIVTKDNVYLGDIYGLFTHPISYWEKDKNSPGSIWGRDANDKPITCHAIVSGQARDFLQTNGKLIVDLIAKLTIQTSYM